MNQTDLKQQLELANQRIEELETRTVYMEDMIDSLNQITANLSNEFALAKQAMQLLNRRLEQLSSGSSEKSDIPNERPPHY